MFTVFVCSDADSAEFCAGELQLTFTFQFFDLTVLSVIVLCDACYDVINRPVTPKPLQRCVTFLVSDPSTS